MDCKNGVTQKTHNPDHTAREDLNSVDFVNVNTAPSSPRDKQLHSDDHVSYTLRVENDYVYHAHTNQVKADIDYLTDTTQVKAILHDYARPHHVKEGIPVPSVDQQILESQSRIFRELWPDPTPEAIDSHPEFCELYSDIKSFYLPNFLGARRTLESGLHLQSWETLLQGYHDAEICFFLRYGWPVGYHKESPPAHAHDNHPSARAHASHVKAFIQEELKYKAIVGPFDSPPFSPWTHRSPIMTRPKKNSEKRRIIIDLSYPEGLGVNAGINISCIYGRNTTYTLPNISDFSALVQKLGPGAWAWKADLSRAYRQLRVDPLDTPLLGLAFREKVYVDLCPSFGCRSSSASCQRVASAVVYLMRKQGWHVLAFLDDFAGIEVSESQAQQAYGHFLQLTSELGLQLAVEKCAPPTQVIQWLGYDINIPRMILSIPQEKMHQILQECKRWANRAKASKTMIQSLVGRLIHIANCIPHARKFVTRILSTLRYMSAADQSWTSISTEFKTDVAWFLNYAHNSNGLTLISPPLDPIPIECDSSLLGAGGNSNDKCYFWEYSASHRDKYAHIHHLEAINLIVAYRTLCPLPSAGKKIVITTDNQGSAYALATGRTKDSVLAACARELWLEAAKADHYIEIKHQLGDNIPLADALSRAHSDHRKAKLAADLILKRNLTIVNPVLSGYVFFTDGI